MKNIFNAINEFFLFIEPISDFFWSFPTNYKWYSDIPVLGSLSFAILLLVGVGIYFSIKTRMIQLFSFVKIIKIMMRKQSGKTGITAFASFMLGLAMRVGPGNIVGITGAISIGGPGALFWMWIAAFFGMATAFMESVLSQIFKEQKGSEFVGGLPFYGRKILGNKKYVGTFLSIAFITYALFNLPAQTFNVFTSIGMIADSVMDKHYERDSYLYYCIAIGLITCCAFIIFGGIRRVIAYTNILVPIKAILFCGISLIIIVINFPLIPYFFTEVIVGAFSPHAIFGGTIGTALVQGVKRGLMSNEAGQGTITMASAIADNNHPCEQGLIQSFGVFCDTMIICTMTGFIVVMAHVWTGATDGIEWESLRASKITVYLDSVQILIPSFFATFIKIIMCLCYCLFAFTTLIGMISFAEIAANFISQSKSFILFIRILGSLIFVPFGALTVLAGLELGNLWAISDLSNILMVYLNIPILLLGAPLVYKTLEHYRNVDKTSFVSESIGIKTSYWIKK